MNVTSQAPMIRYCTPSEVDKLLSFIRLKADHDGVATISVTCDRLLATMFTDHPHAFALFAELDGQVIGYALYYMTYSSFQGAPGLWLDDLYVLESCRGSGIGTILLKQVAANALGAGCSGLQWTTGAEPTNKAVAFYQKMGAVIVDKRFQGRAHVMSLDASDAKTLAGGLKSLSSSTKPSSRLA